MSRQMDQVTILSFFEVVCDAKMNAELVNTRQETIAGMFGRNS